MTENDKFAPVNMRNHAYIEYKPVVSINELVALMKSFCDHFEKLSMPERNAALFIIHKGIESL